MAEIFPAVTALFVLWSSSALLKGGLALYYLSAEYLVSSLPRMRRSRDNKPSTIFTKPEYIAECLFEYFLHLVK